MARTDNMEAIFTIELPNGQVYTGSAITMSFSEDPPVESTYLAGDDRPLFRPERRSWEIELWGICPLRIVESGKFLESLKQNTWKSEEWTCPYCERVWPHSQRKCWDGINGCGASRPAMWWI